MTKTEAQKAKDREYSRQRRLREKEAREALITAGVIDRPKPGRPRLSNDNLLDSMERRREYSRTYQQENKAKRQEQFAVRRQERRDYVNAIKANSICADCGHNYHPVAMDFDHREGEEKWGGKTGGVARLVAIAATIELIQKEIDKCEIVCANCHRIRTHAQNGWYDYQPEG